MLCGAHRPGHFEGVATVVLKLLSIVRPKNAYFGLKDYQQYLVISRMAQDLNLPYNIKGVPTVRERDGLAMSSRNVYLEPEQREAALSLYNSFSIVKKMMSAGAAVAKITDEVKKFINSYENVVEYVELVDPETLKPIKSVKSVPFMCILAVKVGDVRLIDNMLFNTK
jgi:pantoate--beta-alanine ligase